MFNMFLTYFPDNGPPKLTFWLESGELRGPSEERIGRGVTAPAFKVLALWRDLFPLNRDQLWESYLLGAYAPLARFEGPVNQEWQHTYDQGLMLNQNLGTEK